MEWGTTKGLAQDLGFDDLTQGLRYDENQRRQIEAMNMAKAKMFSDDLEFQNASNPYDAGIIKAESEQALRKLGELRRNNPNWASDINTLAQMKLIKQGMKSTPGVLRSIAFKDAVDQYGKTLMEAAKNPNKYNQDDLDSLKQQIDNYRQYGHPEGEVGFKRDGGPRALIFTPPSEIPNFTEIHRKMGDSINPDKGESLNNGRDGAFRTYLDPNKLRDLATAQYLANKKDYDYVYKKKGVDPVQAIEAEIQPYIKTHWDFGETNHLKDDLYKIDYAHRLKMAEKKAEQGINSNPYKDVLLDTHRTVSDPEHLAVTYGVNVPYFYKDSSGKQVQGQGDDFHYTGEIFDKNIRLDKNGKTAPYVKDGVKVTPGFVYKPLEWADENGYISQRVGKDPEDYTVKPDQKDKGEIETFLNKKGEPTRVFKLKVFNEVNANSPEYSMKFNKHIATTKQRDAIGMDESMIENTQQVYQDQAGNKFIMDGNGNPVPYR